MKHNPDCTNHYDDGSKIFPNRDCCHSQNSLTDQAAKVLAEIDAALALAEKEIAPEFVMPTGYVGLNNKGEHYRVGWHHGAAEYDTFIAAARTVCPKALRCLKTAIEGMLRVAFLETGAPDQSYVGRVAAETLTTLITKWNSK